jgi:uncharacterized protein YbaR (Trm112 family)
MPIAKRDLRLLACPYCKSSPLLDGDCVFARDVLEGGALACADCGRLYEVRDGVPFFAPWADNLDDERRPPSWELWARAHANYRRWHANDWKPSGAERARPLFEEFWRFATVSGVGVDVGGARSINREWNPAATIWSVDPESSWIFDPVPKFMNSIYKCWDQPFPFVQGVGELLPFGTGSLDFAIVQGVLDHVSDPEAVIREVRRVLRPGGSLWMMITTVDLEKHIPIVGHLRRRLGRARRHPLQLIEQGPLRFFSDEEQGIYEGHVSEGKLTRESIAEWLGQFSGIQLRDVTVSGIRQLFVGASRPTSSSA